MRDILESHNLATLKKEISKTNIKGYSTMKKADVVNLMLKHPQRFGHIKMKDKTSAKGAAKAPPPAAEPKKKKKKLKIKGQDEKVSNFLGDIEQKGKTVASKVTATSGQKPKPTAAQKARVEAEAKKFLKQIENSGAFAFKEVKAGANAINEDALPIDEAKEAMIKFGSLPPEISEMIAGHLGVDLLGYYNRLKGMKGFKINQFKDQLKRVQKLGKKGNRFHKFRGNDMDRLVVNINRDEENPSPVYARIRKLLKDAIKLHTPEDLKAKEREKNKKPRDKTKVNVGNVYNAIDLNDLKTIEFSDYQDNWWHSYAYSNKVPQTEEGQMRLFEKINRWTHARLKKSIGEYLKGKKFKSADEAASAYQNWADERDMYAELDKYNIGG